MPDADLRPRWQVLWISGRGQAMGHFPDLLEYGTLSWGSSHEICILCRTYRPMFWKPPLQESFCMEGPTFCSLLLPLSPPARGRGLAQWGWARPVGSSGPLPSPCCWGVRPFALSDRQQGRQSSVFYGPIMCEILPIRERLSTQNIDFETHFLLQDYE